MNEHRYLSATNQEVFERINRLNEAVQELRKNPHGDELEKWQMIHSSCLYWFSQHNIDIHLHENEWRFGDNFGRV